MGPITFKTPRHRPPIFQVGDERFIDYTFNFGNLLVVEPKELLEFMATSPLGGLLVGRRANREELALMRKLLMSCEHEVAANLLRDPPARWRK